MLCGSIRIGARPGLLSGGVFGCRVLFYCQFCGFFFSLPLLRGFECGGFCFSTRYGLRTLRFCGRFVFGGCGGERVLRFLPRLCSLCGLVFDLRQCFCFFSGFLFRG